MLLASSARKSPLDSVLLSDALDALNDCIQACIADTDADLGEKDLADTFQKQYKLQIYTPDVAAFRAHAHETGGKK